jgi:hypothetical protein
VAAVLTGALVAVAAAVARGGIGDGRWSTIGSPPLLVGAVVAAEVGLVALAVAGLAGGRAVPWQRAKVRGDRPASATPAVESDDGVESDPPPAETVADEAQVQDTSADALPDNPPDDERNP